MRTLHSTEKMEFFAPHAIFASMSDNSSLTPTYAELYRQAFEAFGIKALWNRAPAKEPTAQDALVVANVLRVEGNLAARRLAEDIERACRAAP